MRRSLRRSLALAGGLLISLSAVQAFHHDKYDGTSESRLDRFAQRAPIRTPYFRQPAEHSMDRAGHPQSVRPRAVPSVTQFMDAGYVGGATLKNNNLLGRGPGSATGPIYDGVFAVDYTGFRGHMGRVFLAPSADPSRGRYFYRGYWAEGPRVTDVFALRPLRKAILEKREDQEKREHGGEGHGGHESGHGAEAGHGAEGGMKEGGH